MTEGEEIRFDENEPLPNYYAVIPADVRYDARLSPRAILIFGELTALADRHGYAWPSNDYFASLYHIHKRAVSRLLHELEQANYIRIVLGKANRRRIYLFTNLRTPIDKNVNRYSQNCPVLLNGKKENRKKEKNNAQARVDFEDVELQSEWEAFQLTRKQAGHSITPVARVRLLKKLKTWKARTAIASLQQSIERGWSGLFEPKQQRRGIEAAPMSERNKRIAVLNRRKQSILQLTRDLTSAECAELTRIDVELRKL